MVLTFIMFETSIWYTLVAVACIREVVPQEIPTPASFLEPRNFNYHPYELRQYFEDSKPTKQGPVLFPNDGPAPSRRPFIVTARPLIESIINSDLNPNPPNNSLAENSQNSVQTQNNPLNHVYPLPSPTDVTLSPDLLANISPTSNNELFGNPRQNSINNIPEATSYNHVPYAEMLLKARQNGYARENGFNDYEERTVLPPIYRALSDHARQNVLKKKPQNNYNYQIHNLDYGNQFDINRESDENDNGDYDQDQNYAFSYRVKDQKTGDDFSHKQQSASGGTNGEYRVRLPDGRTQIVSYTADENGYKADVRYDEGKDEVNKNRKNNINNDYNNVKQSNLDNHYVKQNHYNNFERQNDDSNNFNNVRQYDNQDVARNYYRPQETNINQYEDRIFVSNYVNHNNNNHFKQFDDNQNVESIYFKQQDGSVRQYDNVNLRNDYVNYKDATPIKEDDNQYNSKEYYDYSSEYNQHYEPYNSKFAIFQPVSTQTPVVTSLRPKYAELRPLFTVAPTRVSPTYVDGVISASNNPIVKFESTTENVVFIGGKKVYTNVNHVAPTVQTSTVKNFAAVSPAAYLASTIASLRERMTPKPVIFGNFINTLGKYLNFK